MKKNIWQKGLSYFKDVYLESTSSPFNKELHVILSQGRYQLCTSNAVYSYEDKYVNYRTAFEWINWKEHSVENVLLLGLGLGSVPQMLEQVFKQDFYYTAVEIDPIIIQLAHDYVLNDLRSSIQVIQADALHYVQICQEKYDMIVMDVFENDKVPPTFETKEFVNDLASLLNKDGFVLFNRLNITEQDQKDTDHFYSEVFKDQFQDSVCSSIEGNYMLCSRKDVLALKNS